MCFGVIQQGKERVGIILFLPTPICLVASGKGVKQERESGNKHLTRGRPQQAARRMIATRGRPQQAARRMIAQKPPASSTLHRRNEERESSNRRYLQRPCRAQTGFVELQRQQVSKNN
ncbi:hypothetical protein NE237_000012 [Protea cynaroides]|uniref:Uncharacterized protein n=1 Tax=Protea cynaroides TaxID=273540 RepID=A0A9Q0GML8_9MAGN|nr:hypothetical protein NE237_000012 [Protea cynaroides]